MNIQWYPGHMAKARRMLLESLKMVDVVVEMVDARAPLSTRNPDFDEIFSQKPRVMVLNKADLASDVLTRQWVQYFASQGMQAMAFSANAGRGVKPAIEAVQRAAQPVVERAKKRGIRKTVRAMIVGIPNVGKSTFINRLKGSASAKAGDKPGVTRGKQWIVLGPYLEFLDTPGMLWPKLEDQEMAKRLAFIGSIRAEIMDQQKLCKDLIAFLMQVNPGALKERLKLDELCEDTDVLLERACRGRGWILQGGEPDLERGAQVILDEYRGGKMGRISLERPPKENGDGEGNGAGETLPHDAD